MQASAAADAQWLCLACAAFLARGLVLCLDSDLRNYYAM
jgi:hypothetical protein